MLEEREGFNRRYATEDSLFAQPALKRRPKLIPSLRDEDAPLVFRL